MEKRELLKVAKAAIVGEAIAREKYKAFEQTGATFVTLTKNGALRGCIGTLVAHRPLIDDLIHNAKAAAYADFRFPPLEKEEFDRIEIEVSILSEPKEITYEDKEDLKTKIRPGVDGVIIRSGNHQATFLPQVWEQLPEFDLFFAHLAQKAGFYGDLFAAHPTVYVYEVEKIK